MGISKENNKDKTYKSDLFSLEMNDEDNGEENEEKKEVVVVCSGYFDPIHIGHIECMEKAKALGDKLIIIVNNTEQAILKKGFEFMPLDERVGIVKALGCVDEVFISIDEDESVCKSLEAVNPDIFGKGGDRNVGNIPENEVCERMNIKIVDGLGAKVQASSDLIERAKEFEGKT